VLLPEFGKYAEHDAWARRLLRILPYKGNRDYQYYLDGLKVNGKRRRLFFTSEAEAKEELKKWDAPAGFKPLFANQPYTSPQSGGSSFPILA